MLAIGKGGEEQILEQMRILGANNLIIKPVLEQNEGDIDDEEEEGDSGKEEPKRFTPGLRLNDAESLSRLPHVVGISPEIEIETNAIRKGRKRTIKLVGIANEYFNDPGFNVATGKAFIKEHHENARPVCVIGNSIKNRFFPMENPIGKQIKCGQHWLTVIGILSPRNISRENRDKLGIRNYDMDIYVPIKTILLRYTNRSLVTSSMLERAAWNNNEAPESSFNYHQIDKVILRLDNNIYIQKIAEVANRMLARRHNQVIDFEIVIPETLLEQEKKTKDTFNYVLLAIACISLIVGGIGIMNIMLASVMERIKEIGIRLSLGATQQDIIFQFLGEAIAISITGGILGVITGYLISLTIQSLTGIETIVSFSAVAISFVVAISVGLLFGIYPAVKAARQDPVVSLRHE